MDLFDVVVRDAAFDRNLLDADKLSQDALAWHTAQQAEHTSLGAAGMTELSKKQGALFGSFSINKLLESTTEL